MCRSNVGQTLKYNSTRSDQYDVLVVEDNPADAALIFHTLDCTEGPQFNLEHVERFADALQRLAEDSFDAALLDLSLPDKHGISTFRDLCAAAPSLPVVILTSLDDEELALEVLKLGAQDYLVKDDLDCKLLQRSLCFAIERKRANELESFNKELVETKQSLTDANEKLEQANARLAKEIAERLNIERELTQSEARMRAVMQSAFEGIIAVDSRGKIISWNQGAESIFGLNEDQAKGRNLTCLLAPQIRAQFPNGMDSIVEAKATRVADQTMELTGLTSGGNEFPLELSLASWKSGEEIYYTAVVRDISERKQNELEKDALHEELVKASRYAGMSEVAVDVLHNVGNVLNSVNVSAMLLEENLQAGRVDTLVQASNIVSQHSGNLTAFLTTDARGKHFPNLLRELARSLSSQRDLQLREIRSLIDNIEHIKQVISMQQTFARAGDTFEPVDLVKLVEDALKMNDAGLMQHSVRIVRQFAEIPSIVTGKHQVLQILVNLISNAKNALCDADCNEKTLTLRIAADEASIAVDVGDNGIGIARENLAKIFSHGFTTRKDGHGFGLHSSALAAQELGGSLSVHSDGPGQGSVFTLRLPLEEATP